jgi:hypothetical protein
MGLHWLAAGELASGYVKCVWSGVGQISTEVGSPMLQINASDANASAKIEASLKERVDYEIKFEFHSIDAKKFLGVLNIMSGGQTHQSRFRSFMDSWSCRASTSLLTYGMVASNYTWTIHRDNEYVSVRFVVTR